MDDKETAEGNKAAAMAVLPRASTMLLSRIDKARLDDVSDLLPKCLFPW